LVPFVSGHRRIETKNNTAEGTDTIREKTNPARFATLNAVIEVVTTAAKVHRKGCEVIDCGSAKQITEADPTRGTDTIAKSFISHRDIPTPLLCL
jgi:hypothetical protein